MNIDFHYYGTYVAARLAGYDFKSAQTIAHTAQYVDDSDEAMLKDPFGSCQIPPAKLEVFDSMRSIHL